MTVGDSGGRAERIARRNRAIMADGGCVHCRPHRGENYRDSHREFRNGEWRPIKGKDRK